MAHALEPYVGEWERARGSQAEPRPIARRREEAWQRFLSLGFPTTREEEWRFTSVAPIAEGGFVLAQQPLSISAADVDPHRLPGPRSAELVFVNGRYAPALSRTGTLPAGVYVDGLARSLAAPSGEVEQHLARLAPFERQPFVALNTAFLEDGACITVPPGVVLREPIHLLFVAVDEEGVRPIVSHPRVLVVLGEGSQAAVVETYAALARRRYFTNAVTEVLLGENAILDHYKVQDESTEACHVATIHVRAHRGATCTSRSISLGGALVRNDVMAVLDGEGVDCALDGLYLADGQRLVDHHTTIDHARPHCGSREIYKGILADRARGVFNGKVIVRPDAQKTDAKQTNRALLLSEDAVINSKPQLEIFADDVRCTHGAAVGQLDDEALFYLRSRGLGEVQARQLLIHAFASEVLNRMPLDAVRSRVEGRLQQQLALALPAAA